MYYVYKVKFEKYNAVYIGCTNNVKRRTHQHNENARKEKSFFGRFLKSCGIVLKFEDFEVIAEYEDRPSALKREKEETLALIGTGVLILNDNYSDHCSRKGMRGRENPCSKTYCIVNMETHTYEIVDEMHRWCDEHPEVVYATLMGTSKRKPYVHKKKYIIREIDEWNSLDESEKSDLISGRWYEKVLAARREAHVKRASKRYVVLTPEGNEIEVTNLDRFAREHGINDGNLHASLTTGRSAAGYRVLKRLS